MTPTAKITMFHSSLPVEGLVVENPIGFDTAVISLFRHQDFHSLVEGFKGNFMWFGTAMKTVKEIEAGFGPNAIVLFHFDVSFKTGVFVNLFKGMFKMWQLEEIIIADRENYKLTLPLLQNDFWSKFITRLDSPVNLEGTTDLDGGTRGAINKIVLPMPSQKLRGSTFGAEPIGSTVYEADVAINNYLQIGFGDRTLEEIVEVFTPVTTVNTQLPQYIIKPRYKGFYQLNLRIELSIKHETGIIGSSTGIFSTDPTDSYVDYYYKINNGTPQILTTTNYIGQSTVYSISDGFNLEATDVVYVYGVVSSVAWKASNIVDHILTWGKDNSAVLLYRGTFNAGDASLISVALTTANFGTAPSGETVPTTLELIGDTVFPDTETDAYLIKDAAESIISKIVGQDNAVKSDYLDTCKGRNAIFRGKNLRGHDFSSKALSMSFDEWWKGASPLLFLGLGYTEIAGVKKIEIEDIPHFYDPVPVVNISNVNRLVRRYDLERVYKSIEVGYNKWSSESEGGIDDPQTKRIFNTDFISEGVKKSVLCSWMAASLAIERSRRNRIELGKDDRNDEEIMVVALVPDGDDWLPEFGTVFNAITNLINSDFRINIRHSATRIFKRWQSWFNGCMVYSDTGLFAFSRGEGNYEMTSQFETTDCEATDDPEPILDENADIVADTDNKTFVPRIYEAEGVPMSFATYQDIVANKNKALGISRTSTGHVPMHILDLGFEIFKSQSNMILLQATEEGL